MLIKLITDAAIELAKSGHKANRIRQCKQIGATLRPGKDPPMWSTLREEMTPHLKKYGSQAKLGRLLGLQRQQIHAFMSGPRMPDAERTLQMLAWLLAMRRDRAPA